MSKTALFAIAGTAVLVLAVLAAPISAKEGEGRGRGHDGPKAHDNSGPGNAKQREFCERENLTANQTERCGHMAEKRQEWLEKRQERAEAHRERHADFAARCRAAHQDAQDGADEAQNATGNATAPDANATQDDGNATLAKRCAAAKRIHDDGHRARRAGNALVHALGAMDRRVDRLEERAEELNATLAGGNLTANETAELGMKLNRTLEAIERVGERIEHLQARLDALKAKWQAVREHVAAMKANQAADEA